ncbi:hypothetical protein Glove_13g146 [Diversispora epigaea]|uniref:GATA-type domain-containing protein n=1 Tax=Diversispora epigaea TaxID=1348612 RepID=A0A397JNP4_9GLOM|nr:hypothetical protein Glove_13g146 [Diversispora epigaea]
MFESRKRRKKETGKRMGNNGTCDLIILILQQPQKRKHRRKTKTTIGSPITNNSNEKFYIYHCSNCGARETPGWRRDNQREALLWNICIFFFKSKKMSKTNRVGSGVEIGLIN